MISTKTSGTAGLTPKRVERGTVAVSVGEGARRNEVVVVGAVREAGSGVWLDPILEAVHREAIERDLTEVVLDIRALEYASSGMWQSVVNWMRRLREDRRARYNVRVLSDPTHRWQTVGMSSLRVFGADRLIVDSSRR